jgi:predicted AAA+ superfamily ATPase
MQIHRKLLNDMLPWLGTSQILGIKGTRRVGKTVLLHDLETTLKKQGENTVFLSVEQKRHLPIFSNPKLFIRFLKEQHEFGSGKKLYIFLDEFQYIPKAVSFLKEVHELWSDQLQLIIAASTSFNITKGIDKLDIIRKIFYLHRLSFFEYINIKSEFSYTQKFSLSDEKGLKEFYQLYRHDLEDSISEYIHWGGYPEVISEKDNKKKNEILGDIIHQHIEKDISSFLRVENVKAYIQLMEILSHETGQLLNHQDLSTRLGIHKKTLSKYLDIIAGTFTFSFIPPYFTDTKKELAKMNKVYAQDMGIMSYFSQQQTHTMLLSTANTAYIKNFIFAELRRHHHTNNLYFYRTIAKAEIDFVLCKEKELIPIKIKFGKKKQKVPVVMKNFIKKYENTTHTGIIITQNELRFEKNCLFIPYTLFPFLDI